MQSINQKPKDVEKKSRQKTTHTLPSLQIIKNRNVKLLFDGVPLAVVASTTIMTFAGLYTRSGVDLLYLTGGLAIVVSLLFTRSLFEEFPKILSMLWRRNILQPKRNDNSSLHDPAPQQTEKIFQGFIQEIPEKMNNIAGMVCGLFGILIAGWMIWLLDVDMLQAIYLNFRTSSLWYGIMALVRLTFLLAGFVGGIIGWRILVIADTVSQLGKTFDFDLQINHPDGCGGLKPIGDLCLKLAYVISPVPILLGLWLIFINFFDIRFLHMTPTNLGPLSSTVVFLAIPTAALCLFIFFVPLGSVHEAMLQAKSRLQIELDDISKQIHQLSSSLLKK